MDASRGFDLTHYIFVTLGSLSLALTGKHRWLWLAGNGRQSMGDSKDKEELRSLSWGPVGTFGHLFFFPLGVYGGRK